MNKSIITIIIIIILIIAGIWWVGANRPEQPGNNNPPVTGTTTGGLLNSAKEFTITGGPFYFDPASITVKKGNNVRITFRSATGTHDLKIDEFNAATKILKGGEQETIEFVADKAGSYEYYCSVGNHRAMGMKGTLIVTE